HRLVAELVAEVEPILDHARLTVEARVPRDLPPLRTDQQKLKQILLNLLSNAIKFTPRGEVRITAARAPGREEVAIAVADSGVGIAPEDQERVFDPFQQAEAAPAREHGSGLGLAICRRLASVLGGRISLESEVGRGSTFTVILPLRRRSRVRRGPPPD